MITLLILSTILILEIPLYLWLKSLVRRTSHGKLTWIMMPFIFPAGIPGLLVEKEYLEKTSLTVLLSILIPVVAVWIFMRVDKAALKYRDRHLIQ
ncbi:hypothetical protein [Vreelandella songnenensis]|uniref:hypothetical protein n=1 Tax=Vreelandella songnenensis TaxID=1176243 RepID=UPI0011B26F86|nr:hypothetical protein [Halomonas songnenensis]